MAYATCYDCRFCISESEGSIIYRYCEYERASVDLTPEEGCTDFERKED